MMRINNVRGAIYRLRDRLKCVFKSNYVIDRRNRFKHWIMKPYNANKPSFYAVFKREYFMTFNNQFVEFCRLNPALMGVAESINVNCMDEAMRYDYIIFYHKCGRAYVTRPQMIADLRLERTTKTGETTLSIPLKLLKTIEQVSGDVR